MDSTASTLASLLACTTCCVTKATPIQFTNGNRLKNSRTGLTNHTQPISHHWLLMPSGVDRDRQRETDRQTERQTDRQTDRHTHKHTHKHTHANTHTNTHTYTHTLMRTKMISRKTRRVRPKAMHAWFKNIHMNNL